MEQVSDSRIASKKTALSHCFCSEFESVKGMENSDI